MGQMASTVMLLARSLSSVGDDVVPDLQLCLHLSLRLQLCVDILCLRLTDVDREHQRFRRLQRLL
jgi:hypothetical protein